MTDNDISYADYRDQVQETAEIIIDETDEHDDDIHEVIVESTGRHQWIIYYGYNLDVLRHSDEGPQEWSIHVEDDETDHLEILNAMAYTAFRADVRAKVNDLRNDD